MIADLVALTVSFDDEFLDELHVTVLHHYRFDDPEGAIPRLMDHVRGAKLRNVRNYEGFYRNAHRGGVPKGAIQGARYLDAEIMVGDRIMGVLWDAYTEYQWALDSE